MSSSALIPAGLTQAEHLAARLIQSGYARKIQSAFRQYRSKSKYAKTAARYVYRTGVSKYKEAMANRRMTQAASRMVSPPRHLTEAYQSGHQAENISIKLMNLHINAVTFPIGGSGVGDRQSLNMDLRGLKFCRTFELRQQNNAAQGIPPVTVHWALIQLKCANKDPAEWEDDIKEKFFRSYTDTNARYQPFINNGPDSGWTTHGNCLPVNPSGEFKLLSHRKWMLTQPRDTSYYYPIKAIQARLEKYVPVKQRLEFDRIESSIPTHPIIECIWYQTNTPHDYPLNGNRNAEYLETWFQNTVFFNHTK